MIYRQFLVMRKALIWYVGIILAAAAVFMVTVVTRQTLMCGTNTGIGEWLMVSGVIAAAFTAIYGAGLGNASRDGARVFWVLPKGRLRSGLALICADCAGGLVAVGINFIGAAIVMTAGIAIQNTQCAIVNNLTAQTIAVAIGFPLAVYGWATLTGMLLRRVAYMGIVFLPFGLIWQIFSQQHGVFAAFLRSIAFANPFNMLQVMGAWQLWGITVVTLAIALALWQRAEVVA